MKSWYAHIWNKKDTNLMSHIKHSLSDFETRSGQCSVLCLYYNMCSQSARLLVFVLLRQSRSMCMQKIITTDPHSMSWQKPPAKIEWCFRVQGKWWPNAKNDDGKEGVNYKLHQSLTIQSLVNMMYDYYVQKWFA